MNYQNVINITIQNINQLLRIGKLKKAIKILQQEIAPISEDLEQAITINSAAFASLESDNTMGLLRDDDYRRGKARIMHNLINTMATVEEELEVNSIMASYNKPASIYKVTSEVNIEKIHGRNTLVSMQWIYKCIEVSKSVCQVLTSDGGRGTGWMLNNGWMMTNWHVIPNAGVAANSKIRFDYEENLAGGRRQHFDYELEPEGAIFSDLFHLDYAYIKVKDNPSRPVSSWGQLEVETFLEVKENDPVTIIQHPRGEVKQIALTENKVIKVDNSKVFYMTDTDRGSSGSPVLNHEWKVVALHHAGKTEEDGGLVINETTGERAGANEGLLIKDIMKDIEEKQKNLS